MATQSFYSDNVYRHYPLVDDNTIQLDKRMMVGLHIICDYSSPYLSFPTAFFLGYTFVNNEFTLTFDIADDTYGVIKSVAVPISAQPASMYSSDDDYGVQVQVIVGNISDIPRSSFNDVRYRVEPTLVKWMHRRGINSIRIGNKERNRIGNAEMLCKGTSWPPYIENAEWWVSTVVDAFGENIVVYLQDTPLIFSNGYNDRISVRDFQNTIIFEPTYGGGLGVVATDLRLGSTKYGGEYIYEDQYLDDSIVRMDGLAEFDLVVGSICSIGGPYVSMLSTKSVSVRPDPDSYTLYFDVASIGGAACATSDSSSSSSSISS